MPLKPSNCKKTFERRKRRFSSCTTREGDVFRSNCFYLVLNFGVIPHEAMLWLPPHASPQRHSSRAQLSSILIASPRFQSLLATCVTACGRKSVGCHASANTSLARKETCSNHASPPSLFSPPKSEREHKR